jgi:indole-3-glycerol phosphate synthase
MQVDIRHSLDIVQHLPTGVTVVSESGISSARELQRLREGGIHGVLIGEYFMKSNHPGRALRSMLEKLQNESQN